MGFYYRTYLANDPNNKSTWKHIGNKIIEQREVSQGRVSLAETYRYLRYRDINIDILDGAMLIETESSSHDFMENLPYETLRIPIK